jgi:pyruvate/oxaloacetate carboxyltransferase
MAKRINKLLLPIAILCTAFALPTARAEQSQVTTHTPGLLAVQLPGVDHEELVDLVTTLRSQLILRKQELMQTVENSHFEGSDAILAAILPGGLLYAGFQKARHEQAREELEQVDAEIEQYSSDILAMQPAPSPVAIFQLP